MNVLLFPTLFGHLWGLFRVRCRPHSEGFESSPVYSFLESRGGCPEQDCPTDKKKEEKDGHNVMGLILDTEQCTMFSTSIVALRTAQS